MIGGEMAGKGSRGLADLMRGGSAEAVPVAARDVASSSSSKPASALDMMRYQRIGPDCLPVANGSGSGGSRKPPALAPMSSMEDDIPALTSDSSRRTCFPIAPLETKPRGRPILPPPAPASAAFAATWRLARDYGHQPTDFPDHTSANPNGGGGSSPDAAMMLRWGHNKRSRGRRDAAAASPPAPAPAPAPTPAITPAQVRRQASLKIRRRASAPAQKQMPPPSTRGPNLRIASSVPPRPATAVAADALQGRSVALAPQRSVEERAVEQQQQQSAPKQWAAAAEPPKPQQKKDAVGSSSSSKQQQQQSAPKQWAAAEEEPPKPQLKKDAVGSSSSSKQLQPQPEPKAELPRINTTLSRKEKEEDFMAMKGTKLPQRPKKRSKNAEKAVSYIYPGAWLGDVSRSRYQVRERKRKKQKRQGGLKGMENSDTD